MPATPSLFERITDQEALWLAWLDVKANKGGPGGDGETVWDFEPLALTRIARLSAELRTGLYIPGPYRRLAIPKKSGGLRPLAIPCVVDRVAMRAAAIALGDVLEPEFRDSSYGYRPGRSVQMAVARVAYLQRQSYGWVVDGDIETFFDEAEHDRLLARLARSVDDQRVLDLVGLWLEGYADDNHGLPQGSPISPILANLYLDDIDEAIEKGGVRLVRFGDDFVLLTKSEAKAKGALERMAGLLRAHGLELHPDKTRIRSFAEGFRFLGKLFVRSLVLDAEHDEAAPETAALAAGPLAIPADAPPQPPPAPAEAPSAPTPILVQRRPPEPVPPAAPPEVARPLAPVIRPLYVMESGRRLSLRNDSFTVMEDTAELLALPPGKVDRIDLGPQVGLDEAALRQALAWRIPVFLLDGHGRQGGMVLPGLGPAFDLHLAQARTVLDPAGRLALAKALVEGRIRNQHALLKRLNRKRRDDKVAAAADALTRTRKKLKLAPDVDAAMGYEGEAGRHYWPALGRCLEHGWKLTTRTRRPAETPVNAVLNWLSSMLTRDLEALVGQTGLHPGFGALHATRRGAAACAFDLVEEFRAPLAEGLAVYLFNNRLLDTDDFAPADDGAVRLIGNARATVIRQFEAWLDREIKSPRTSKRIAWRGLMAEQVQAYARHCLEGEPYAPYRMDY